MSLIRRYSKLLGLVFLPAMSFIQAQNTFTVQSSCVAPDSVMNIYKKDADRMALRRTIRIGSPLKDSISIDQTLSKIYLRALTAVHNATGIPARDTVVGIYNIHTSPTPELNSLLIEAGGNNPWMQKLFNSIVPTGYAPLDQYIIRYSLYPSAYYVAVGYDRVVLTTDSNINIKVLAGQISKLQYVNKSEEVENFNDTRNIEDSLDPGFVTLTYSYGWGTCYDGCDYRKKWTFIIDDSCVVEYTGASGDALDVGLFERDLFPEARIFPNPTHGKLNVTRIPLTVEIYDHTGRLIGKDSIRGHEIDLSEFNEGIYFLRLSDGEFEKFFRIVKLSP